jgi:hypothetical protein
MTEVPRARAAMRSRRMVWLFEAGTRTVPPKVWGLILATMEELYHVPGKKQDGGITKNGGLRGFKHFCLDIFLKIKYCSNRNSLMDTFIDIF